MWPLGRKGRPLPQGHNTEPRVPVGDRGEKRVIRIIIIVTIMMIVRHTCGACVPQNSSHLKLDMERIRDPGAHGGVGRKMVRKRLGRATGYTLGEVQMTRTLVPTSRTHPPPLCPARGCFWGPIREGTNPPSCAVRQPVRCHGPVPPASTTSPCGPPWHIPAALHCHRRWWWWPRLWLPHGRRVGACAHVFSLNLRNI